MPTASLQTQAVKASTASVANASSSHLALVDHCPLIQVPHHHLAGHQAQAQVSFLASRASHPHQIHNHRSHSLGPRSLPVTMEAVAIMGMVTWEGQMQRMMGADVYLARLVPDAAVHQASADGEWEGVGAAPAPTSCAQTTSGWV